MNSTQGGDVNGIYLSNVFISNPATNNVLSYNGGVWTNSDITGLIPTIPTGYTTNSNTGYGLSTPSSSVGTNNVWIGYSPGSGQTGSGNVVVGASSSAGSTANNSTVIGSGSTATGAGTVTIVGQGITGNGAIDCTFVGQGITAGTGGMQDVTIIGNQAGSALDGSRFETLIGWKAGNNLTIPNGTLSGNTIIGALAQSAPTFGTTSYVTNSTIVGNGSGCVDNGGAQMNFNTIFGGGTKTSSNNQVLIGGNITGGTTYNGAIALGSNCIVREINCLHLGGDTGCNLLVSTAATAGTASALPATPQGYLVMYLNNDGVRYKIPFYKS